MNTVRRTTRLPVSSLNALILDEETPRRPEHDPDIRVSGRQYTGPASVNDRPARSLP